MPTIPNGFATAIKDEELATKAAAVEEDKSLTAAESKEAIARSHP